jgi:hypothetical protein
MEKEINDELLNKLVKGEQQVIRTSFSDISVSVSDESGDEKEYIYPQAMPSDIIASTTAANLGIELEPTSQKRIVEKIEEVKESRFEEFEVEAGLPKIPLLKIKIRRAPKKTITRYTEQQEG